MLVQNPDKADENANTPGKSPTSASNANISEIGSNSRDDISADAIPFLRNKGRKNATKLLRKPNTKC